MVLEDPNGRVSLEVFRLVVSDLFPNEVFEFTDENEKAVAAGASPPNSTRGSFRAKSSSTEVLFLGDLLLPWYVDNQVVYFAGPIHDDHRRLSEGKVILAKEVEGAVLRALSDCKEPN